MGASAKGTEYYPVTLLSAITGLGSTFSGFLTAMQGCLSFSALYMSNFRPDYFVDEFGGLEGRCDHLNVKDKCRTIELDRLFEKKEGGGAFENAQFSFGVKEDPESKCPKLEGKCL